MSTESTGVSKEELFAGKKSHRRNLATLPIEEKIKILIKLQHMANKIGHEAGRQYRKPWDIKV